MSQERLKALMAMLHVVDPSAEDGNDKLRKVRTFLDYFKERCKALHQPFQNVSVDERMVKSKPRSGIRQYIKRSNSLLACRPLGPYPSWSHTSPSRWSWVGCQIFRSTLTAALLVANIAIT